MVVAIIIARGGSKRLLRKNVLQFCGLPLVEWTILQTCCSHSIGADNTYLSTDDDEIAEIGMKHKIHIIRRPDWPNPDELSGGVPTMHAIKEISKKRKYKLLTCPMPTAPIRFPDDLDKTVKRYHELKKSYPNCREISWVIPQKEMIIYKFLDDKRMMLWLMNKTFYFGLTCGVPNLLELDYYNEIANGIFDGDANSSDYWMKPGKTGRMLYYIQGRWFQTFDIDDQDDFELCEILMKRYILKDRGPEIYKEYAEKVDKDARY